MDITDGQYQNKTDYIFCSHRLGFPGGSDGKILPAMQETCIRSLGWEDPLQEGMATHSSILAWRILWTEEPGELQSRGLQRVGLGWATKHSIAKGEALYSRQKQALELTTAQITNSLLQNSGSDWRK